MSFLGNITAGNQLGYYWTGAAWAKFGLSDTGNLKITGGSASGSTWTDGAGDLQLKNGLGIDIQSTGTFNVNSGASTLGGNLSVSGNLTVTGTSEFNNTVDVDADFAVRSGTTDKFTVASATGNTVVAGNLTINGSLAATQLTGTADNADNINIDEANGNTNYQVTFSALNNAGYNRQYIDTDNSHLVYNPATATLSGLNISGSSISATTFTGALSGNASSSTQVRVTDNAANTSYALLFSLTGGTGTNRDLYTDGNSAY